jgi:cytochrome c553
MILVISLTASIGRAEDRKGSADEVEFFEKKIRPILVARCAECHGDEEQSGGLRLDTVRGIERGGDQGPPLRPGDPNASLLIQAVRFDNQDFQMPPTGKIPSDEIQLLEEWVQRGGGLPPVAEDEQEGAPARSFSVADRRDHWAYQPIARPVVPVVRDPRRAESPIDLFLQSAREAKGLRAVGRVSDSVWLRRVTFDLIGLPPTVDELHAWDKDPSPDARDRVLDRLLASPAYGERWARHWLDLVRYSETLGHEFDYEILNAWRYRDYVVRALNTDLPFDQFTVEHVAGDLIQPARRDPITGDLESPIGTGFFWFGEGTHSPVDVRQAQTDRIDNQIDVLSKTFLAQSVACARCHDHKFDAISQADYYAIAGYLKSSRFDQVPLRPLDESVPGWKEWSKERLERDRSITQYLLTQWREKSAPSFQEAMPPTEKLPELSSHPLYVWRKLATVDQASFADRANALRKELEQAEARRAGDRTFARAKQGQLADWFASGEAFAPAPSFQPQWRVGTPTRILPLDSTAMASDALGKAWEGVIRSPSFTIESDFIHIEAAGQASRINLVIDGFVIIRDPIYGGLTRRLESDDVAWRTIDVRKWVGERAYIEVIDSTTPNPSDGVDPKSAVARSQGYFSVKEVVFSSHANPPASAPHPLFHELLEPIPASPEELAKRYAAQVEMAGESHHGRDVLGAMVMAGWIDGGGVEPSSKLHRDILQASSREEHLLKQMGLTRRTPAMADGSGEDEFLLVRGNHRTPGAPAARRFLEVFSGSESSPLSEGSGRLSLAERLVGPDNPLTPRVLVNRLWKHHLGEGMVRSVDDFGRMGQPPTHPALLDWLTVEFLERGWSIKEIHRVILSSDAAQLASEPTSELRELDPLNEYYTRGMVRRLEAEAVRDAILQVSGRLDRAMEGASVMPLLTDFMPPIGRPAASGPLDGAGRRSLYLSVRRNFLTPMLLAFDYPLPQTTIGRRNVSNVPAQALSLLNDPFVLAEARRWAENILAAKQTTDERIDWMYESSLGRLPDPAERERIEAFLASPATGPTAIDRWTSVCHAMVNAKEFVFLP